MKRRFALSPSLERVERRLFGVSDGLIEAVLAGETSQRIAQAVKASPEWTAYNSRESMTESEDTNAVVSSLEPPDYINELIRRRVEASRAKFSRSPARGQIVEVRKIITPPGSEQLDWIIQAPLYVLLDQPGETDDLWQGWLASADTDYASSWDFVLQEQDAPFDPECGMVQIWNPVSLYLPMAGRVVAELRAERMDAVRAMAADFLVSNDPQGDPWPGRVAVRSTSTGIRVATGSPIGGQNDPRWRYQNMYHYAAEAVRTPANLVLAKSGVFEQDWTPETEQEGPASAISRFAKGLATLPAAIADRFSSNLTRPRDRFNRVSTTWGPALAFAVVVAIGIAVVLPRHETPVDEWNVVRGAGDSQVITDKNPQQRLASLTSDLDLLKLRYKVSTNNDAVMVQIEGLDPTQPAILDFMQENGLRIAPTGRLAVEIRKSAIP